MPKTIRRKASHMPQQTYIEEQPLKLLKAQIARETAELFFTSIKNQRASSKWKPVNFQCSTPRNSLKTNDTRVSKFLTLINRLVPYAANTDLKLAYIRKTIKAESYWRPCLNYPPLTKDHLDLMMRNLLRCKERNSQNASRQLLDDHTVVSGFHSAMVIIKQQHMVEKELVNRAKWRAKQQALEQLAYEESSIMNSSNITEVAIRTSLTVDETTKHNTSTQIC